MTATASNNAIELSGVTKVYSGKVHALRGIDLRVSRGEIFGLLGPNGAGKSTLVKIMLSVVRPTAATGTILGHPVGHKPTLARIGYLPENHRFPRYLTGRQTIEFFSSLSGFDVRANGRCDELLKIVGMTDWADRRIGQYSKGMMQRIGIAVALGADPELIVLDEPTDGVDPAGRRDIRNVLFKLRDQGKTIFINSHLLSELESLCDRVAVLVKGAVSVQGTMQELTERRQFYQFELASLPGRDISVASILPAKSSDAGGILKGEFASDVWWESEGQQLRVGTIDPVKAQDVIDLLRRNGVIIKSMHIFRPSLEELYLEAVGNSTPGAASSAA